MKKLFLLLALTKLSYINTSDTKVLTAEKKEEVRQEYIQEYTRRASLAMHLYENITMAIFAPRIWLRAGKRSKWLEESKPQFAYTKCLNHKLSPEECYETFKDLDLLKNNFEAGNPSAEQFKAECKEHQDYWASQK